VVEFLHASSVKPIRTSVRSPWQNGVAERWVGSVRREVLDHVRRGRARGIYRLLPGRPHAHRPGEDDAGGPAG
jgi:transposase InsO family protein